MWIHFQCEKRTHYEMKSAIAYRGWQSVGDDRYELVDKRVYFHASEQMRFWRVQAYSGPSSTHWTE